MVRRLDGFWHRAQEPIDSTGGSPGQILANGPEQDLAVVASKTQQAIEDCNRAIMQAMRECDEKCGRIAEAIEDGTLKLSREADASPLLDEHLAEPVLH
jgi:anti-sigma28 factor (negative regulator of flagellin synthesis)